MIVADKVVLEKSENDPKKLNLLLDLDSTIIYSKKYKKEKSNDLSYPDEICSTVICEYMTESRIRHIHIRNNSMDFLKEMKKIFNIYIYTMGIFDYAASICQSIEKLIDQEIFSGIISRHGNVAGQFKYFYVLEHLNINNTIIIDDNSKVWIDENRKNLIKITPFIYKTYQNYLMDDHLKILKDLLVSFQNDMRNSNLHEIISTINICYQSMI